MLKIINRKSEIEQFDKYDSYAMVDPKDIPDDTYDIDMKTPYSVNNLSLRDNNNPRENYERSLILRKQLDMHESYRRGSFDDNFSSTSCKAKSTSLTRTQTFSGNPTCCCSKYWTMASLIESQKSNTRKYSFHRPDRDSVPIYLPVHEQMSSYDAIIELCIRERVEYNKDWTIIERNCAFNLERIIEDHENLYDIRSSWLKNDNNKFLFKKDIRRTALFENNLEYFPTCMIDIKFTIGDVTPNTVYSQLNRTDKERVKTALLNCAANMPDIQGTLHFKNGRNKWKKFFFVLRPSGLYYSTKNQSKEPRHLVYIAISDYEIYRAESGRKTLESYNDYCIVLKKSNDNDLNNWLQICTEDERSREIWHNCMRLVKYRDKLKSNFDFAVSKTEQLLSQKMNDLISNNNESDKVAMDFSGSDGGRVIKDPQKAYGCAIEEASSWRRKGRIITRSSPASRNSFLSNSSSSSPVCKSISVSSSIHQTQSWFFHISREKAESMLISNGASCNGLFLVRDSQSLPNVSVLSFIHEGNVKHVKILHIEQDGKYHYTIDNGNTKFNDIIQLVDFYKVNQGGLPTLLKEHVCL